MTTYSEIKIIFNNFIDEDSVLSFDVTNQKGTFNIDETWKSLRTAPFQVSKGNILTAEASAIYFIDSFNIDYNGAAIYQIIRIANELVIKSKRPEVVFLNTSFASGDNNADSDVDFEITNFTEDLFLIDSIGFEQATNPDTHVKLKVVTSELASIVLRPEIVNPNNANPFYLEMLRNGTTSEKLFIFSAENINNQQIFRNVLLPNILAVENLQIKINNSPNGATIIINQFYAFGLDLEYSLDDTDWQTSNIFNGILGGNYTVYIRDNYGAKISKEILVDDFGIDEPYLFFSKANSLRYVKRFVDGISTDKKIDENRFSFEDFTPIARKEIFCFENNEVDITQFKTNYSNLTAKGIDKNGNETQFVITKKTNNLRLKDSRNAIKYNLGNGQTGIYFNSGKTFDFDTGLDNNEDYALNGNLPEWAKVDEYVRIDNAWFQISNLITDNEKEAEVIVIENEYLEAEEITKVSAIYNRENYDIYEFPVVMNDFNSKYFNITFTAEDDNFESIVYETEDILVKEDMTNFSKIVYSNDKNTDINYTTGIEHQINLRVVKESDNPNGESENHKTDTKTILLNGSVYQQKEIEFEAVTPAMLTKLFLSFFHRKFYYNGVKYVLSDVPEVEGAIEESNLYKLTARLIKANDVYNSRTFDNEITISDGLFEIPGLLSDGENYIKY